MRVYGEMRSMMVAPPLLLGFEVDIPERKQDFSEIHKLKTFEKVNNELHKSQFA